MPLPFGLRTMSAVGQRDGESDRRRTDLTDRSIKHGVLFVLLIYLTPNSFVRAFQNVGGARRGGGDDVPLRHRHVLTAP